MQATFRVRRFPTETLGFVLAVAAALILAVAVGFWIRGIMTPVVTTAGASQAAAHTASSGLVLHKAQLDDGQQPRSTGIQY